MDLPEDIEATLAVALPHERVEALPSSLTLRALDGKDSGKVFAVRGPVVTGGREPEYEGEESTHAITLSDPTVSLAHFELRRTPHGFLLRDLGSTNGTWVGLARIPPNNEVLVFPGIGDSPGSTFRAGGVLFELVAEDKRPRAVSQQDGLGSLLGSSSVMRQLYTVLVRLAPKPVDVLLCGETGTGKGAVARALHELSGRKGPFVKLDSTHLNRELAESMIMGHCKGAFTGAHSDRIGFVERADGGTLFIDEIGELPWDLQAKLLRVLDDREVVRVGETAPRPVDVRVLCATHRNLHKDVADDRFRRDLYHRISPARVHLAPLRERTDDIPQLALSFLAAETRRTGCPRSFGADALDALQTFEWPGNVRQLKGFIQFAAAMSETETIDADTVRRLMDQLESVSEIHDDAASDDDSLAERLEMSLREARDHFTRVYCAALMKRYSGNVAMAAEHAGYGIKGFRELLLRLGEGEKGTDG